MSVVRVVIADDSEIATERIEQILATQPRIKVVARVYSAHELITAVALLSPDAVTLDLLMPGRTGLVVIRELSPRTSVVVVSDHDQTSMLAREALAQGAVGFVEKRSLASESGRSQLLSAVLRAQRTARYKIAENIVAIAGSTGAIPSFEAFARDLSTVDAMIAIVQHLPATRMKDFSGWLSTLGLRAQLASGGEAVQSGRTYVAPGDKHLRVERGGRLALDDSAPVKGHKPSATVLFESLLDRAKNVVCVVLSGMGDDGAAALPKLVRAGARCFVQRRDSCAVSGMPDAALLAAGARGRALAPSEIGAVLKSLLGAIDG